jgi:hypothetical protein
MVKRGRSFICDRCGEKVDSKGCELIPSPRGEELIMHVDLCGECWRKLKVYLRLRGQK